MRGNYLDALHKKTIDEFSNSNRKITIWIDTDENTL